jgi:hypothetical protein
MSPLFRVQALEHVSVSAMLLSDSSRRRWGIGWRHITHNLDPGFRTDHISLVHLNLEFDNVVDLMHYAVYKGCNESTIKSEAIKNFKINPTHE